MDGVKVGFALCGSFCTFDPVLIQMRNLVEKGYDVYPIMSNYAYATDTRFGTAEHFRKQITEITGKEIIHTIEQAEPIGPRNYLDIVVVAPCTGNTVGKLANGITDTSVTMAVKAHLRNQKPVLLGVSTNDALGSSAKNIGLLMNTKNIYFIPMKQDNPTAKPRSVVFDFDLLEPALYSALNQVQLQAVLL